MSPDLPSNGPVAGVESVLMCGMRTRCRNCELGHAIDGFDHDNLRPLGSDIVSSSWRIADRRALSASAESPRRCPHPTHHALADPVAIANLARPDARKPSCAEASD